jgi:sugar phosphate isomerase/epimerase
MKLALMIGAPDMQGQGGYVAVPTGSFDQTVGAAARLGFDGVEVLAAERVDGDLYALKTALAQAGLKLAGLNSGRLMSDLGLMLLCGNTQQCNLTRSAMYDLIRLAAPFATHINIGMFRGLPDPPGNGPARARLITILQELGDYAARLGVELLLEPQNQKEFPFIYSTRDGVALVREVGRPNVALMLDTFHMMMEHEEATTSLELAMPYLRHIHFLDKDRNPPAPDDPVVDVRGILRTLARHNYRHYLSMPLVRGQGEAATAALVRDLRAALAANSN